MNTNVRIAIIGMLCSFTGANGQGVVDGASYPGLFGPDDEVRSGFLGASRTEDLGDRWTATVSGAGLVVGGSAKAEAKLTGDALQFKLAGSGSLVTIGGSPSWSATTTFDKEGAVLELQPETKYRLSFDVDGRSGLLNSVLAIAPSFSVELLDGAGEAVGSAGGR